MTAPPTLENILPDVERADFVTALQLGFRTPLAALQAAMESLSVELGSEGRSGPVDGALEGIARLARNARELIEWARPPALAPLTCTAEEIASAARLAVPATTRHRILYAHAPGSELFVDAPVVTRCLTYMLLSALEASEGPVLLQARRDASGWNFAVVHDSGRPLALSFDDSARPFAAAKPGSLGIGLALARREIERMGGDFSIQRTELGHSIARATLPCAPSMRAAA